MAASTTHLHPPDLSPLPIFHVSILTTGASWEVCRSILSPFFSLWIDITFHFHVLIDWTLFFLKKKSYLEWLRFMLSRIYEMISTCCWGLVSMNLGRCFWMLDCDHLLCFVSKVLIFCVFVSKVFIFCVSSILGRCMFCSIGIYLAVNSTCWGAFIMIHGIKHF